MIKITNIVALLLLAVLAAQAGVGLTLWALGSGLEPAPWG